MKRALSILSFCLLLSGCAPRSADIPARMFSMTSRAQPELVTGFVPPILILTSAPPSILQIVWPNDFTRTNFIWWCEVADTPNGPWRYPSFPQFPDATNWIVKLNGAHFIRTHCEPL